MTTSVPLKRSRYTLQTKSPEGVYLFNTYSGQGGLYPADALRVLKQPGEGPMRDRLVRDGHLVAESVDEFERARRQQLRAFLRDDTLHLILFSTEQCNFRCVYCYEKFEHGRMRPEVREGVKRLVERRAPGLRHLSISWFGGEPLLAHDVVRELSEHFTSMSEQHGFSYNAHATTNGYFLTPELAPALINGGLRDFQITLDGDADVHDAQRPLASGKPTFDRIWSNLLFLRDSDLDFTCTLRINFSKDSIVRAPAFVTRLGETFGFDGRFRLHVHPVGKWGGANDDALNVFDMDEGFDQAVGLYQQGRACGLDVKHANLNPFGSACYAAFANSLAIRTSGAVVKCTVALDDERNQVGRLLADGSLLLNQERMKAWVFDNALEDPGCQACAIRPACQGAACPLARMDTREQPCPDIKRNFKQFMPLMLAPVEGFQELQVL